MRTEREKRIDRLVLKHFTNEELVGMLEIARMHEKAKQYSDKAIAYLTLTNIFVRRKTHALLADWNSYPG